MRVRNVLVTLFGIGLLLRLVFALLPLDAHLIFLEDDAWMVAAIARNFVLGHGITADGINPTNGFQPLYPLTLGALPWILAPNNLDLAFTFSLVITAILNALTAFPLYGLARRFTDARGALIAVALFTLNPFFIRISVNAMETSLGILLLMTSFYLYYTVDLTRGKNILLLALVTALAALARLDALLAFGAIGLVEGARALLNLVVPTTQQTSNLTAQRTNAPVLRWLLYGAATLVFLLPYLYRNVIDFGSIEPSSSRALAYMHSYAESFAPWAGVHIFFATPALDLTFIGSLLIKLVVLAALAFLFFRFLTRTEQNKLLPLLLFVVLIIGYYGYILQHNVTRYYVGVALILFIIEGMLLARMWSRYTNGLARGALALFVFAIIGVNSYETVYTYTRTATAPWLTQPAMYRAALWVRDNLDSSAQLGAVNSGILQYYSNHVVVNLDGKLNMDMVPVFEQRALLGYLYTKQINYLVDLEDEIARRVALYDSNYGNAPVHRELGITERMLVFIKLIAASVGIHTELKLDDNRRYQLTRSLSDIVTPVQTFTRQNESTNPVVVFRLK